MLIGETAIIALRSLRANKLRASLTMLGLVIGVAAVIVLVAAGQGVSNSVTVAISTVANNITVVPLTPEVPYGLKNGQPLTEQDVAAVGKAPDVALITPLVSGSAFGPGGESKRALVVSGSGGKKLLSAQVTGTMANWFATNNRQLDAGTYFTPAQVNSGARVTVVGPTVADVLFGSPAAAIGKTVTLARRQFLVVGVMKDYGRNLDNNLVMPMSAARAGVFGYGLNGDQVSEFTATATSSAAAPAAVIEITQILSQRHRITNPLLQDFQVQTLGSRLDTFNQIITLLTDFVPAIAAISLLVGGIGVLNIMLVSVTDRTREIGTRKAVGASDSAILTQFGLEAITLTGIGGLIGVGVGVALVLATGLAAPLLDKSGGVFAHFYPVLSLPPILVAFAISLAIGVIAGAYPAWRASRLNPIEALRYE
jgi:putative ABC transport system permease protein